MLLVLAVLCSCIAGAFVTTASAVTINPDEMMIADWVFNDTVSTRGAEELMKEYSELGITDVFLLCKGTLGSVAWQSKVSGVKLMSSTKDILQETCTAAKKYGIRVHAWMAAAQDSNYIASDANAIAYHFRHGIASTVTQYVDMRDSGYRAYMRALVKELNAYDIAGVHFDYIRYANIFYDWGGTARNLLLSNYGITQAEYNAATMAMARSANVEYGASYQLAKNGDGYYVYTASGGTTPSGVTFGGALAGNGSTDALNGAKKVAQMRKDNLKSFITEITQDLSSDKLISCAIMPESVNDAFAQASYCQDPAVLKDVCDFVAIMSYTQEYGAANTWPGTLSEQCAKAGLDNVVAIQTFDTTSGYANPKNTDIYAQYTDIISTRNAVNKTSGGKILGIAFFRGAKNTMASAYVKNSTTMNFKVHAQDELGTAVTKLVFTMKNGVKISSITNKSGWGSASFSTSSDKTTLTISYSNGMLADYGSASFDMTYTGTVSADTGACMLQAYNTNGEDYAFCSTIFPKHTHSYTSSVTTAATCTTAGVRTYTCSCGDKYTESIAATDHTYDEGVITKDGTCKEPGVITYTCTKCSATRTEETAKGTHKYAAVLDPATGMTTYTCSVCGYSYVSACGEIHKCVETWETGEKKHFAFCYNCSVGQEYNCYFEVKERVNATCTTDGSVTYVCAAHYDLKTGDLIKDAFSGAGCTNTYTEVLPAGCTYIYVSNLDGTHKKICSACEKVAETAACTIEAGACTVCGYNERSFTLLHFRPGSAETTWKWELANTSTPVSFGTSSSGSLIGTTTSSVDNPYFYVPATDPCSIQHTIAEGDILEVRVRMNITSNPEGVSSVTPDFRFQNGSTAYASTSGNGVNKLSVTSKDWQVVQIPVVCAKYPVGYVVNRILFDPWSTSSSLQLDGTIEIDYIYLGQADSAPSASSNYLYFDFTNTDDAARRYNNNVYEGNNFDVIPWAYNSSRNNKPVFDYGNEGTMSIGNISGTYAFAQTTTVGGGLDQLPLEYPVVAGDVVEIRFKTEHLVASGTPQLKAYFMTNEINTGTQGVNLSGVDSTIFARDEYITVSASLTSMKGNIISAIRPQMDGISDDGTGLGKIIFDYIYVGPADTKPSALRENLTFDFKNNNTARDRYDTYVYGFYNYDIGGWGVNENRNQLPVFDNELGTMKTVVTGKNPYLQINADGPTMLNRPLNFNPSNVEMVQVRFKMTGLCAHNDEGEAKPSFSVKFVLDEETQPIGTDFLTYNLTEADLTSGEYITVTMPTNQFLQGYNKITSIHLVVNDVISSTGEEASVTYDYIYVGPKMDDISFVYFYGEDQHLLSTSIVHSNEKISYVGALPMLEYNEESHYDFVGWKNANGQFVDLETATFTKDVELYAAFEDAPHEFETTGNEEGHFSACSCGYALDIEEHTWDEGEITTPATCQSAGIITYSCYDCDYKRTEAISADGHDFIPTLTEPTCEAEGFTTFACSGCGYSYKEDYVSALGHSYSFEVVDPTCEEVGYTIYTCDNCGDSFRDEFVPVNDHDYNVTIVEGNCVTEGSKTSVCVECGHTIVETIAKSGHSTVYRAKVPATCTSVGTDAHYECVYCHAQFLDAEAAYAVPEGFFELPKLSHRYTGKVTTEASCTEDGVKTFTCANCGDSYEEAIAAYGHDAEHRAKLNATCTENGYQAHYVCTICDVLFMDANCQWSVPDSYVVIEATGHNIAYTNEIDDHTVYCTKCSYSVAEAHNFVDGACVCGQPEYVAPVEIYDKTLEPQMAITVGADMSVVFTVAKTQISKFTDFYLVVEKNVAGGESIKTVYGAGRDESFVPFPNAQNPFNYRAPFTGINAKEMGDKFSVTLYGVHTDGTIYYGPTQTTSIKDYLINRLNTEELPALQRTMYVDMLKYAAVAQNYLDYDTDNIVTDDLTDEHLSYGTQAMAAAKNQSSASGSGKILNTSVVLKSRVTLTLSSIIPGANVANMKFVVRDALTGNVIKELPAEMRNGVMVSADFDDVAAKQMRRLITVTLYDGNTAVSQTVTWSIESYVAATRTTSDAAKIEMLNAMLIYGDSVAAYMNGG